MVGTLGCPSGYTPELAGEWESDGGACRVKGGGWGVGDFWGGCVHAARKVCVCVPGLEEGAGTCTAGGTRVSPAVPPPGPGCSSDAGGVQVCAHPEAGTEGEASHDAALRAEVAQGADEVPGSAVEEEQHEDHVSYLPESAAPSQ